MLQATLEALSAKLAGRAKPEDHRQAIAAAQRRRHAACRVLRAVEEVRSLRIARAEWSWVLRWQQHCRTPSLCHVLQSLLHI